MFDPRPTCGLTLPSAVFVTALLLAGSADSLRAAGAEGGAPKIPDFEIGSGMAWREIGDEFLPPPSGPGPVTEDPEHPFRSNGAVRLGQMPTYHIGDATNPIL